ncbi:MAG: sulfatase-like hydrolase/transferase, partial [Lysobacterales bacterium]
MANSAGFSNKAALLVVATFVLQLCFFAPLSALSSNIGEFSVSYINIIIIYIILSLLLIVLLAGLVRITGGQYLLPLLTFFSAAAFLESRLFLRLAGHAPFDGSLIDWQALQWLAWLEVVVLAALAAFFALYRRRVQMLSTVSLFILLFLAAGLAHMVATHRAVLFPPGASKNAADAYFDGFSRLSGERDVVHIVPDQAQGALFHDILREDPGRYGQVFEGFTVFTQATGRYKSTYPSVLFYMTGESPEPEYDMVRSQPFTWRYIADTLDQVSIVTTLARNGFSTYGFQFHPGIFCRGEYTACTGTHDEVFGGVPIRSPARRLANAVTTGLDLGLFQATPVFLRKLVFDDGRWLVRRLSKGEPTHSGVLDLFVSGLRADADQPTYNYFHHAGAHAPLLFDRECNYLGPQKVNQENQREQAHCTLAQLQDLLQALKANGLYDQSMIVVHGDH